MSLFAPVLLAAFLIAVQGFLLQSACAIAGEETPDYGPALLTALIAGLIAALGSGAWGCTFGLLIGLVSPTLAWVLSAFVGAALTANVYRSRLDVSAVQAIAITVIHHGMAWILSGVIWALFRWAT